MRTKLDRDTHYAVKEFENSLKYQNEGYPTNEEPEKPSNILLLNAFLWLAIGNGGRFYEHDTSA